MHNPVNSWWWEPWETGRTRTAREKSFYEQVRREVQYLDAFFPSCPGARWELKPSPNLAPEQVQKKACLKLGQKSRLKDGMSLLWGDGPLFPVGRLKWVGYARWKPEFICTCIYSCTYSRRPVAVTMQDLYKAKEIDSPRSQQLDQSGWGGGMHTLLALYWESAPNLTQSSESGRMQGFWAGNGFPREFSAQAEKGKIR